MFACVVCACVACVWCVWCVCVCSVCGVAYVCLCGVGVQRTGMCVMCVACVCVVGGCACAAPRRSVLVELLVLVARARVGRHLLVVLLQHRNVLPRLGELPLLHPCSDIISWETKRHPVSLGAFHLPVRWAGGNVAPLRPWVWSEVGEVSHLGSLGWLERVNGTHELLQS